MFRWFLTLGLLFAGVGPLAAQSDGPSSIAPTPKEPDRATVSTPPSGNPKRVWSNEDLGGPVSASANKPTRQNPPAPSRTADPATIDRIKKNLKKLQEQLADVNLKLDSFRKFQQGENVSSAGRDLSKGYTRTPIEQQVATLQDKKKQLELQIDALYEQARKKEIEPGQLR
jgi:hypothetical protein